ncbi:MAG: ribonuclease P protein component [Bacillota bacterium]|nr:ribonuclease P protein component [Bacillota bacterium]
MLKKEVLRKKEDFTEIYKRGKSIPERYIVFFFRKNGLSYNRTAFLASKKVGNSVQRNRAKRLMKESFRLSCRNAVPGHDMIFVARNSIKGRKFSDVDRSLIRALKKGKLLRE